MTDNATIVMLKDIIREAKRGNYIVLATHDTQEDIDPIDGLEWITVHFMYREKSEEEQP